MSAEVLCEQVGAVTVLTLNRPERRNAITRSLLLTLDEHLVNLVSGTRAVVLTGAGTAFCSGADLHEARRSTAEDVPYSVLLHQVARTIHNLDLPVVAAVNGPAIGAGMGLALMADVRVMADEATFSEAYIKIGTFPGAGDTTLLPQLVGTGHALRLLWTGDVVDAHEARSLGLVEMTAPANVVKDQAVEFASRVAALDGAIVGRIKRAVLDGRSLGFDASLDLVATYAAATAASKQI